MVFFNKMEDLHNIVLKATKDLLNEKSVLNKEREDYLSQLTRFSLLRKNNLLLKLAIDNNIQYCESGINRYIKGI